MKFKIYIFTLIFCLLFILTTPPSFSQPSGMRSSPGMKHWKGEARCWRVSDLNLSPEQLKGLNLIQQTFLRETLFFRVQLFSKRLELRELLTNPALRIESIRVKYWETIELQSKLEEKTIEYLIKLRNLLTQEQLKSWCPEKEFPFLREMIQGPTSPMGPMHPRRPPSEE